jgi:hypothetical protein
MCEDDGSDIAIVRATERQHADLEFLASRIEAEDHPDDAQAAAHARRGMAESLPRYDALTSDSVWLLIAYHDDRPAWPCSHASQSSVSEPGSSTSASCASSPSTAAVESVGH